MVGTKISAPANHLLTLSLTKEGNHKARVASPVLTRSPAPFESRIPVRRRTRSGFLAPFLGLIWLYLHSKTSSFSVF